MSNEKKPAADKYKTYTQEELNKILAERTDKLRNEQFTYNISVGHHLATSVPHLSVSCVGGGMEDMILLASKINRLLMSELNKKKKIIIE